MAHRFLPPPRNQWSRVAERGWPIDLHAVVWSEWIAWGGNRCQSKALAGTLAARCQRVTSRHSRQIYERYCDRIFSHCASVCSNPEARRCNARCIPLGIRSVDQLRDRSKLRPWLYAIARNECLRQLRARKRDGDGGRSGRWPT